MRKNNTKINIPLCILLGVLIAVITKTFVIDIFKVNGSSMERSVKDGSLVFVNKLAYGIQNPFKAELLLQWRTPQVNDVIIYIFDGSYVIKRCVATTGTELKYIDFSNDSEYILTVGNKVNIELNSVQYHRMYKSEVVPKGYVLAIGDNYKISYDSRDYGFVPEKNILGKAICR